MKFDEHRALVYQVGFLAPLNLDYSPVRHSFGYGFPLPTPTDVIEEIILEYQGIPRGKSSFIGAAPSLTSPDWVPTPKIMY
jgi:hypothetical protein